MLYPSVRKLPTAVGLLGIAGGRPSITASINSWRSLPTRPSCSASCIASAMTASFAWTCSNTSLSASSGV
ncbi:hypothetical protein BC831DRAFT_449937 [Entophlyctis helioformis]|nr:hypothetical protein BC831DRAFT_478225 [Entophlyctis helioformis]KAI8923396.1 hypothetical protein BC831DRAFT_471377 [Entophlyctis helioformis]KAI8925400.1 hypothetical protein BC831DRAFT_461074 [Entophlyctis helioformis]KAI8925607.1 hypothetical protein BC831DRAFT_460295 [Entophlyctis helioformis]KAI8928129.1 hypothetical protein BC831DRAFT_449937 [Entophlyctis helioformis]